MACCNLAARAAKYRENPRPAIERATQWQRDNPERYQAKLQEYAKSGKKKVSDRKSHLKRKYGLTLEDFDALLASQDGGCAICGKLDVDHVDHDHHTGRVRRILCFRCNVAIGQMDDEPERLLAAASYLTKDDDLTALARERGLALAG